MMRPLPHLAPLAFVVLMGLGVGACGGAAGVDSGLSGRIKIDGSSTVAPMSEAAAEVFQLENNRVRITVGTSGTGGGFEKFCEGEIDISDASRPIKEEEEEACRREGIAYEQVQVALDGIAVVIHPDNDFAACLTTEQLKTIWDRGSEVDNWRDVDPSFPDEELKLFGPGTDSGTFDYFTEQINGEEGRSRTKYAASEDDNVIVQGVAGSKGGLGYMGLSYALQNEDKLKAARIGPDCVEPSTETVQNGTYEPLGRPLFIYPSDKALRRPAVRAFLDFYLHNAEEIAEAALFVPMTDEQRARSQEKVESLSR